MSFLTHPASWCCALRLPAFVALFVASVSSLTAALLQGGFEREQPGDKLFLCQGGADSGIQVDLLDNSVECWSKTCKNRWFLLLITNCMRVAQTLKIEAHIGDVCYVFLELI